MKDSKGFSLLTVIIIICVTSITSAITIGVIITSSYRNKTGLSYEQITNDSALNELLEAYSNITNNYYEDVDKNKLVENAIDSMLNYLGDSYTTYLDPSTSESLEERLSGTYEGIGIEIKNRTIVRVLDDTPAKRAGLEANDEIIAINGIDVINYTASALSVLIKNSEGEKIEIKVLRGEEEKTFYAEKETLISRDVYYEMKDNNIGYMAIEIFSKTLDKQVKDALVDLESKGMAKLIIDLRSNTGGYLDVCENIANYFLENGKLIYSLENKDGKESFYDNTDMARNYPIVILMNKTTASASEILASALKDSYSNTVYLIGVTSFGKGKVQQTYDLNDGAKAKYTTAKWLRPNGECIDEVGLTPDFEVSLTYEYDDEGNVVKVLDTQLDRAIEIISAM